VIELGEDLDQRKEKNCSEKVVYDYLTLATNSTMPQGRGNEPNLFSSNLNLWMPQTIQNVEG